MSNNQYGLDHDYFERKIAILHRDGLRNWTPDELARELARMSHTADRQVMLEPEFSAQSELAALWEELVRIKGISDNYYSLLVDANQSLAAAEQRNARYESLLRQIIPCLAMSTNTTAPTYIRQITEALPQPTESGASE